MPSNNSINDKKIYNEIYHFIIIPLPKTEKLHLYKIKNFGFFLLYFMFIKRRDSLIIHFRSILFISKTYCNLIPEYPVYLLYVKSFVNKLQII